MIYKYRPLLLTKTFFVLILLFFSVKSIFLDDNPMFMGYGDISIRCSLKECANQAQGYADYRYYLNLGNFISSGINNGIIERWVLITWPPGMGIYYAILDTVSGNSGYLPVINAFLLGSFWVAIIGAPLIKAKSIKVSFYLGLISVLIINLDAFQFWMLSDNQLYSETVSIAFFCISLLMIQKSLKLVDSKKYVGLSLVAGLILGLAAYTRAVFDLSGLILFPIIVIFCVIYFLQRTFKHTQNLEVLRIIKSLSAAFVAFALITSPWRWIVHEKLDANSYSFSPNSNQIWINGWIPTKELEKAGNSYFVEVGMNGFCQVYPVKCREIEIGGFSNSPEDLRNAALDSIVANPVPWLESRNMLFYKAFQDATSLTILENRLPVVPFGLILALIFFVSRNLNKNSSLNKFNSIQLIIFLPMIGITVLPLWFSSFESRYLYPMVLSATVLALHSINTVGKTIDQ